MYKGKPISESIPFMGMFDSINYTCKCPVCGHDVTDFQSKDGECTLVTLQPEEVGYFYCGCNVCSIWIEFEWGDKQRTKLKMIEPDMSKVDHLTKKEMLNCLDHKDRLIRNYSIYKLMPLIKEK